MEQTKPLHFGNQKKLFLSKRKQNLDNVSPMKYLPDRNFTEKTRYKSFGIGLGY